MRNMVLFHSIISFAYDILQQTFQLPTDLTDKLSTVAYGHIRQGSDQRQVLGHATRLDGGDGCLLQFVRKCFQICQTIQLSPLAQSA